MSDDWLDLWPTSVRDQIEAAADAAIERNAPVFFNVPHPTQPFLVAIPAAICEHVTADDTEAAEMADDRRWHKGDPVLAVLHDEYGPLVYFCTAPVEMREAVFGGQS